MQVLCLYGPWKSKPRLKSELHATAIYSDTFWLQSFGTRYSSLENAEICVLLYSFCFVLFWIWGQFSSPSPRRLAFRRAIYRRVFYVTRLGGLHMERLIFGILRYFDTYLGATCVRQVSSSYKLLYKYEILFYQFVKFKNWIQLIFVHHVIKHFDRGILVLCEEQKPHCIEYKVVQNNLVSCLSLRQQINKQINKKIK